MSPNEKTCNLLLKHCQSCPQLQMQDIFKFIHQSAFGCEHMVASLESATDYIQKEYEAADLSGAPLIVPLDGAYSRVCLTYLDNGLSAQTLGKLFYLSAKAETNGKADVENKLSVAAELARRGKLPFSVKVFEEAAEKWKADGYPAVHHSDSFRNTYKPAYRVIANKFVPFLPLFAKLDQMLERGTVTLAIEGGSASGKSTLGTLLETLYGCTVLHTDDFFLRPAQRTPERYKEVGGNIDYERFSEEVLLPLGKREPIIYRKFDCSAQTLSEPHTVLPEKLTVVEGVYSMHPKFENYYNLSVFLDIAPELQAARIAKRNTPELAKRFHDTWIPLENLYFEKMQTQNRCSITISVQK